MEKTNAINSTKSDNTFIESDITFIKAIILLLFLIISLLFIRSILFYSNVDSNADSNVDSNADSTTVHKLNTVAEKDNTITQFKGQEQEQLLGYAQDQEQVVLKQEQEQEQVQEQVQVLKQLENNTKQIYKKGDEVYLPSSITGEFGYIGRDRICFKNKIGDQEYVSKRSGCMVCDIDSTNNINNITGTNILSTCVYGTDSEEIANGTLLSRIGCELKCQK